MGRRSRQGGHQARWLSDIGIALLTLGALPLVRLFLSEQSPSPEGQEFDIWIVIGAAMALAGVLMLVIAWFSSKVADAPPALTTRAGETSSPSGFRDSRQRESRLPESRYPDSRYHESRHHESRYRESRYHEPRAADSKYRESGFSDSRHRASGFSDSRHRESRYRDDAQSLPAEMPPRPQRWSPVVFDLIEWRRFEAAIECLFQQAGFELRLQSRDAGGGVDIWLYSRHQSDQQPVSVVHCQHGRSKRIGVEKLEHLLRAMSARKVRRGQFVTTGSFTTEAVAFARENGIHLLGTTALLNLIGKRPPQAQAELLEVALAGDYWRPTCVNCGVKMIGQRPRSGGSSFWGCVNYPRCKKALPMRVPALSAG
jgi:restriction system protein